MIELAQEYEVQQLTSLGLMQFMLEEAHIDLDKIKQIVGQWQYDQDTPYARWKQEYRKHFKHEPPKG